MAESLPRFHNVVACQAGGPPVLETRPLGRPAAGEVLLRLRVVGFCGTDLVKLETGRATPGSVLGHELVGEVVARGSDVAALREGDRVAVPHHVACGECRLCRQGAETMCPAFRENLLEPGGFADHVLARPRAAALAAQRLPDELPDEVAVFLEPAACVLRGVQRSGLLPGTDAVAVVQGAGSMGLLHLLVIRAWSPACRTVVVDPIGERRELAAALGAGVVVEPGEPVAHAVAELSAGLGADSVFDTVGNAPALTAGLELTRKGGSLVLFAHAPEGARAGFEINELFRHERRLVGTYSGSLREQREIFGLMVGGALDPSALITHRLPLDDFNRGVELVRHHRALKVLFTPSVGSAVS